MYREGWNEKNPHVATSGVITDSGRTHWGGVNN